MRVLLLLLLLWQPGQALGHAALIEASPMDGAVLDAAPARVLLRFDEAVTPIGLSLAGPGGAVPLMAEAAGYLLGAALPAGLARGTYVLSWRVTSADSHPVAGSLVFGVGVAPGAGGAPVAERWSAPSMAARWLFLAALLVAAGGALFRLVAEPPPGVRAGLAWVAWGGVALAASQVGLRGALLADAPSLLAGAPWALGAGSRVGGSLAVSGAGLAACAVTLRPIGRAWRWVGVAGAVAALSGLALSGHAATAEPRWLTAPALALHGVAAAFWVGAFLPLLGLLRGEPAWAAVRRFSAAAIPAVAVLLLSGAVLAVVQVGSWAGLLGGLYGRLLLVKLALVLALLGVAGWNRLRGTPALRAGPLRRSIGGELALAGLVLGVTAVLGLTPPARAVERAPAGPVDRAVWTQSGGIGALIEVAPGRAGRNRVAITIDRARPPLDVWLELRQPDAGVASVRRRMRNEGGQWVHDGPELAVPGRWSIRAEALLTEFEQTSFTTELEIP